MTKNHTLLITGASSGIGAALSEVLASPTVTLLLTGRDAQRLAHIAQAARAKGARTETAIMDVTDAETLRRQIKEWDDRFSIDTVIANAGISGGMKATTEAFSDILNVNLAGTLNTILPLIPRMTARRRGTIVLMSSMAGFRGLPNAPAYSVSKVAVRALGDALRPLLKPQGIRVTTIFPGFVETPLTDVNRFPMPFLMSADQAACIIARGLARNDAVIAFPRRMRFFMWFLEVLPRAVSDWILTRLPRK